MSLQTCPVCEKEFKKRGNKIYCSEKCRMKRYYEEHKEEMKIQSREWKRNHKNRVRDTSKQYNIYLKNLFDNLKMELGCSVCGYNKCPEALHFHHTYNKNKYQIDSRNFQKEKSQKEIKSKKQILFCANCHIEHHTLE